MYLRAGIETACYDAKCVEVIDPFGNRIRSNSDLKTQPFTGRCNDLSKLLWTWVTFHGPAQRFKRLTLLRTSIWKNRKPEA